MKKTKYDVYVKNEYITTINSNLIKIKGIDSEGLKLIIKLHKQKHKISEKMLKTDDKKLLKEFADLITNIEFDLQKAWGFEQNIDYHKFWYLEKCECPKLDNDDRYPHGNYIITNNCPIHGI